MTKFRTGPNMKAITDNNFNVTQLMGFVLGSKEKILNQETSFHPTIPVFNQSAEGAKGLGIKRTRD